MVTEITFSLLPLPRYLSQLTTSNSYMSRGSNRNSILATSSENVTITRLGVLLVTIQILDFVTQFIEFREFSKNHLGKTQKKSPPWFHQGTITEKQFLFIDRNIKKYTSHCENIGTKTTQSCPIVVRSSILDYLITSDNSRVKPLVC